MIDLHELRALVASTPIDELPAMIGELEQLKAAAWARLTIPAPVAVAPTVDAEMLTAEQLATRYSTPKSLFYELARRGDLPHVRLGHYVRFRRADVEQWIAANSKSAPLGTTKKRNNGKAFSASATALLPRENAETPCQPGVGGPE
jgi:excisionase family DNA binding protein